MRSLLALSIACLAVLPFPAAAQSGAPAPAPAPVEIMILGTYHMSNPGLDLVNMRADDVTTPQRQQELAAVADAIAAWRPTRIFVEFQRPAPFTVKQYHDFTPDRLRTDPDEITQIGYRLAHMLGHREVYAFDERPADGEPDYFQFDRLQAWAEAHGQVQAITDGLGFFQNMVAEDGRAQAGHNIAELLLRQNDPARDRMGQSRGHYAYLAFGDADAQVGSEFNSYWYMRNAKMFAKIALVAQPGDRVLVLVGSGHRFWLTHFAELTPGFQPVDPRPFLTRAAAATRR